MHMQKELCFDPLTLAGTSSPRQGLGGRGEGMRMSQGSGCDVSTPPSPSKCLVEAEQVVP